MLPYLIAALIALAVTGVVLWVGQMFPAQPEVIRRLQEMPGSQGMAAWEKRRREERSDIGGLLAKMVFVRVTLTR